MSPGRRCLVTSSSNGRAGLKLPKSTATGILAAVPAATARSTAVHSGPVKCAVLMPTMMSGYWRATLAVASASMSCVFCSIVEPPAIPRPTMLSMARTRVRARSITRVLKSAKLRHPDDPRSTTVVTPLRNVKPSGGRLRSPEYSASTSAPL